ncbi:MAG: MGMT family protein [Candidatus Micrarchaeaceae archaeon]
MNNLAKLSKALGHYRLTSFQKEVLLEVAKIPRGQTRTYKQIAELVGRPKAFRAVGTAVRINPLAPMIPCHRVVRSDGIGNYSGKGGKAGKIRMLRAEGAIKS